MFIYKDTHLGILIWVIYVTHNYTQALDHSLPDHVRLILSKHLLQHGQHQGAANLLLQRQTVTAKKKKRPTENSFRSYFIILHLVHDEYGLKWIISELWVSKYIY